MKKMALFSFLIISILNISASYFDTFLHSQCFNSCGEKFNINGNDFENFLKTIALDKNAEETIKNGNFLNKDIEVSFVQDAFDCYGECIDKNPLLKRILPAKMRCEYLAKAIWEYGCPYTCDKHMFGVKQVCHLYCSWKGYFAKNECSKK